MSNSNAFDTIDQAQNALIEEAKHKQHQNQDENYHFDLLKIYFGKETTLHGIKISVPTIGKILNVGEVQFYSAIAPFVNNPTSIRALLYDSFHKDWTQTKEIEVGYILLKTLKTVEPLHLLFPDLDWSDFQLVPIKENESDQECNQLALVSPSQQVIILEDEYTEIAEYIRTVMCIHPKTEKIKGKTAKLWAIQEDKMKAAQSKHDNKSESTLLPLISGCVNHPGFKYKVSELEEVNIFQFMDSVNRIQKYEQGVAALSGMFSGMVSSKDIPQDLINFMGAL